MSFVVFVVLSLLSVSALYYYFFIRPKAQYLDGMKKDDGGGSQSD